MLTRPLPHLDPDPATYRETVHDALASVILYAEIGQRFLRMGDDDGAAYALDGAKGAMRFSLEVWRDLPAVKAAAVESKPDQGEDRAA